MAPAALAEHDADLHGVAFAFAPWHRAADLDSAAGRHQDAGHHLDGGALACSVRPDVADQFAGLNREAHLVDGADRVELPGEQRANGAEPTFLLARAPELLHEVLDANDRWHDVSWCVPGMRKGLDLKWSSTGLPHSGG